MYNSYKKFIQSMDPYNKNIRIAVSYSGGTDSGVLLDLTVKLFGEGLISRPVALYFNHNLRGKESVSEERFVKKICAGYGIDIIVISLDVLSHAERKGLTIETAARELRYSDYEMIARKFDFIAQGHHSDDNAETVFFNIMRGAGLEGACGIKKIRGAFIRPLLEFTRSEISDYARRNNIGFVEDSSNIKTEFSRNRIRNVIFPMIEKELNRDIKNSLNGFSRSLTEARDFINKISEKTFSKIVRSSAGFSVVDHKRFNDLEPVLRTAVLQKAFKSTGCTYSPDRIKTAIIKDVIQKGSGSTFQTEDYSVSTHGNNIIIINKKVFCNNAKIGLSENRRSEFFFDVSKVKGNICMDKISVNDKFIPFGKKKAEKISKVLSDKKIPPVLRDHLLCLRDDEKIIFIQGAGISSSVGKDDGTENILYINVKNDTLKKLF